MFKKAVPVWAKEYVNEKNILIEFSKKINFSGENAKIRIAADALYRLFVNGKMVAHGPQRAGKGIWRMDEISLNLQKGENDIAIYVERFGVHSFEYVRQPSFLMAEIDVDGEIIASTDILGDFEARRILSKEQVVERYTYQRPFLEVWNLPIEKSQKLELITVNNITVMERTAPYPEYNVFIFSKLVAKGKVKINFQPEYHDFLAPSIINNPTFAFSEEEVGTFYRDILYELETEYIEHFDEEINDYSFKINENEFESFKLPFENTGFVKCTMECSEDSTIYFIHDEVLTEEDILPVSKRGRSVCILPVNMKAGKHEFLALEPKSIHFLKVLCVKGSVKISDLKLIDYVNSKAKTAKFNCNDDALNRVYEAAVHTFEQNAVDIYMDCPSRERAGWLCDSFFIGRVEKDLTGRSDVEKGFLENFFYATDFDNTPDGMVPMCYPSSELKGQFIPSWAMFLIIELEEYVQRTGDTAILELAKKRLYGVEEYFKKFINEDGLLENLDGWNFVEWSKANEWVFNVNFPTNMMYYAMLKSMARMYNDAALNEKAENIKATVKKLSFNGKFFRDHQVYDKEGNKITPEDITEVCQYYAFFTGIADKNDYPELLEIIANDFGAGHKCEKTHPGVFPANAFIGNYLRMEVLAENGYRKQIINEIKEYFDYMAKLTGTLWEKDSTQSSCNHGFASHAIRFIFRDCLGIDKVDEINKTVYLNDDYNAPENVEAILPLINGNVKITIEDGVRSVEILGDYKIG